MQILFSLYESEEEEEEEEEKEQEEEEEELGGVEGNLFPFLSNILSKDSSPKIPNP